MALEARTSHDPSAERLTRGVVDQAVAADRIWRFRKCGASRCGLEIHMEDCRCKWNVFECARSLRLVNGLLVDGDVSVV